MATKKEVDVAVIEKAKRHLEKLPPKEPTTKPVMDALADLKPTIETALERGYSREEVVTMLAEKGVSIKPYQLKKLFAKNK